MYNSLIECIPNFSEGRDSKKIREITDSIEKINGVKLLHVDSGKDTNRTVVTFVGTPDAVCEATFNAIKTAAKIIDMREHYGKHPRIGSTDVCPLTPLRGIDMETTVEYARKLAKRVGENLEIPVYCYEYAAFIPERKNLAFCRKGEYESLPKKLLMQKPDFGPNIFSHQVAKTGATIIGARNFLIAVNFNLNTKLIEPAKKIASEIREKGNGAKLKGVKAIGWYIDDFGIAQVSVNITDIKSTPLHAVFDEVAKRAKAMNLCVTGTEIVGLIPEETMFEAGRYFLSKRKNHENAKKEFLIETAIRELGLENLSPFILNNKILEYRMLDKN
ncbi:MAG: glutamate formimidoyltransferase [Prevotellaceae bacterium]|jgi:glutamate formiminotransferase/formiminotetrahydrofolate cyclodeaminase|nr:glutamate formimidoyltransferase [Prevotellaceae bacterium]